MVWFWFPTASGDTALRRDRRLRTKTAATIRASPARPPTTPPAIAPAFVFLEPELELSPAAVGELLTVPPLTVDWEAGFFVLMVWLAAGSAVDSGRSTERE